MKMDILKELSNSPEFAKIVEKVAAGKRVWKRYRPSQINDCYYWIDGSGDVIYSFWSNSEADSKKFNRGNCYETEAEARLESEKQLLLQELSDFADNFQPDWNDKTTKKYYMQKDAKDREVWADFTKTIQRLNNVYFEDEWKAKDALSHFGDRLNILFK